MVSNRYTKKDVGKCAARLAKDLGHKFGDCWKKKKGGGLESEIGCWTVDYNAIYGGAVIQEIMSKGGGITQPFGAMRRKPREFCETINFAQKAIRLSKKGK